MTQLSDTQALILTAAAERPQRVALPLPDRLRGGAAAKVVGALIAKGLLEEVDAELRKDAPVWRETGGGHGVTLVATGAGLAAIGFDPEDAHTAPASATEAATGAPVPVTRPHADPAPTARTPREGPNRSTPPRRWGG